MKKEQQQCFSVKKTHRPSSYQQYGAQLDGLLCLTVLQHHGELCHHKGRPEVKTEKTTPAVLHQTNDSHTRKSSPASPLNTWVCVSVFLQSALKPAAHRIPASAKSVTNKLPLTRTTLVSGNSPKETNWTRSQMPTKQTNQAMEEKKTQKLLFICAAATSHRWSRL